MIDMAMPEHLKATSVPASATTSQRRKTVWQEAARRLLQGEMVRHGYSYKELARLMGEGDSEQSLITRINRGTFSFAFFLQAARAIGTKSVDISHLSVSTDEEDIGR